MRRRSSSKNSTCAGSRIRPTPSAGLPRRRPGWASPAWTGRSPPRRCSSPARRTTSSTRPGNAGEPLALMFAFAKAGAILHPVSWRLAPAEVAYQLDDAEPDVFLIADQHRKLGEAALDLAGVQPARALEPDSRSEPDSR